MGGWSEVWKRLTPGHWLCSFACGQRMDDPIAVNREAMNSAEKVDWENPPAGFHGERPRVVSSTIYTSYPFSRNQEAHPLPPSGLFKKFWDDH